MKILFITNIPSPYRVDFFNELGEYCDLTVLFERYDATDRESSWLDRKAISFNAVYLSGINIRNDSALCFSVIKWLNDKSFDLIVVGGYSTPTGMLAIEYMNHKQIPYILNSDGGLIKSDNRIKYLLKKSFISKAYAWLSTSEITDEYLKHYGAKKSKIYRYPFTSIRKGDILYEPIKKESKLEIKRKLNIKEEKVILSVGQFVYRKGFDVLIKAATNIERDVGVYIIGGEPTEEYEKLVMEHGLTNICFIGFKTKKELSEYYKAADVFVLPTREDIWGLVINEAMAYGLPVVTTKSCVAGLELIKDGKNGYIVPVNDSSAMAEKINILCKDEKLNKDMSIGSIDSIASYTIENMAKACHNIFSKLKQP